MCLVSAAIVQLFNFSEATTTSNAGSIVYMAELELGPVGLCQSYAILATLVPKMGREAQCYKAGYAYKRDANRGVRLLSVSPIPRGRCSVTLYVYMLGGRGQLHQAFWHPRQEWG